MSHKTQLVGRSVLRQVCWQCLGFVANEHGARMVWCAIYIPRRKRWCRFLRAHGNLSQALCIRKKSYQPSAAIYTSSCRSCAALCGFLSAEKTFYVPDPARFEQAGHLMQPCRSVRRQLDAYMSISSQGLKKLACCMQTSHKCILLAKAPMMRSTNICVHHGAKRGDKAAPQAQTPRERARCRQ